LNFDRQMKIKCGPGPTVRRNYGRPIVLSLVP
jgi:hypothetical protein